ncbi:arylesterase [Perlucidibaca piscinae]|uniref:arylesterase n=1 Tax=Perlucidibaca piscinae TaxID=392589 RepID=UPI00041D86C1|nr:arylesterase [Perlucidibaca piscinae]
MGSRIRGLMAGMCLMLSALLSMQASAATILIVGDSISAAYGMDIRQGWVSLLEQRLQRQSATHQVINASVSGETTSGGLQRLPRLLRQHRPDLVVLELGGNDGLRGQPPALMQRNLERMVRLTQAGGGRVIVAGMRIPPNYGRAYTDAFAALFPAVARSTGSALVPFLLDGVGGRPEYMQADGLHPNVRAQALILKQVWPVLERELRQVEARRK